MLQVRSPLSQHGEKTIRALGDVRYGFHQLHSSPSLGPRRAEARKDSASRNVDEMNTRIVRHGLFMRSPM
ncbi:MAG: hypothetical protein AB7O38_16530 [Pirellulaceae bacterium]